MAHSWGRVTAAIVVGFADDTDVVLAAALKSARSAEVRELTGMPIDGELFAAAREREIGQRDEYPAWIHITATDGSFAKLKIPFAMPADAEPVPDPPPCDGPEEPPKPGWEFTDATATYGGIAIRLDGKKRALLKMLVGTTEPIPVDTILSSLWTRSDAMVKQNVYVIVNQLKAKVR